MPHTAQPKLPTVQQWMFENADITKEKMGSLIQLAIERTEAHLTAKTRRIFCTRTGQVVIGPPQEDWAAQSQASERILKYMLPRVTGEAKSVKLIVPDWGHGEITEAEEAAEQAHALEAPSVDLYTAGEKDVAPWDREREP